MQVQAVVRMVWFLPEALVAFFPLMAFQAVGSIVGIPSGLMTLVPNVLLTAVSISIVRNLVPLGYRFYVWIMGYVAVGVLRQLATLCAEMF